MHRKILPLVLLGLLWAVAVQAADVPIKVLRSRSVSTTTTSRELVYASVPAKATDQQIADSVKHYAVKQRQAAGIDEVTILVDLDLARDCEKIIAPYLTVNDAGLVKQNYSSRDAYTRAIEKLRSQKSCKALY